MVIAVSSRKANLAVKFLFPNKPQWLAIIFATTVVNVANINNVEGQPIGPINTMGPIYDNNGIVTQGQSGGTNIVVPKPPPREIDEGFKQFIRTHFPDKSREMATMVLVGDDEPERSRFAAEIEDFLKSDGYKTRERTYFLSPGGTPQGVVIDQYSDPSAILLKIGVNNRQ